MLMKPLTLIFIMFISISLSFSQNKDKPFRILSYNIMEGLKKDSIKRKNFISWAGNVSADVIALQEVNHYSAADLENLAAEMGYPYCALLKEKGYPTAILSRHPLSNVERVTADMLHGYLYAQTNGYHLYVLHLNPFDYQKRNVELQHIMRHASKLDSGSAILLMGDFNSLSPTDSAEYNSRPRKLELLQNHERTRPHIKNVNQGKLDYTVIQNLVSAGYIDSWKTMHPRSYQKSAPTGLIKADPDNSGRIDYVWTSKNVKQKIDKVYMIDDQATNKFSDHYPIIIELKK